MDENVIIEKILSKYNETTGLKILKQILGTDRINGKRLRSHMDSIKKDKEKISTRSRRNHRLSRQLEM